MNFDQLIEKEIEHNKSLEIKSLLSNIFYENLFDKNFLKEIISNRDWNTLHILYTYPFKSTSFDFNIFNSIRIDFFDLIRNNHSILSKYSNHNIEFILALYFHRINKSIQKEQFFNIIQTILKAHDTISFLDKFSFICDDELNNFILKIIENKIYSKFLKLFKQESYKISNIKLKIFENYYNKGMIEPCVSLLNSNYNLIFNNNHSLVNLIKFKNHSNFNNFLDQLVILSYLVTKDNCNSFLHNFTNELENIFRITNCITENEDGSFIAKPIISKDITSKLLTIYKNTELKYCLEKNNFYPASYLFYCGLHQELSQEEDEKILNILVPYFNQLNLDIDDFSYFNNFLYLPCFLNLCISKNKTLDIKSLLNSTDNSHIFHSICIFLNENTFNSFRTQFSDDKFTHLCYSIFENCFTTDYLLDLFVKQIFILDKETFLKLNKKFPDNLFIQQHYTKLMIDSF